ncbi:DNA-directed RNA polymerase II subunit E [Puccinia sorghi]|uniref:DNA-directed RNA polymerases I, II, and III subunit RPABC1 n=1 Tax=Puccinia sorghi TaxID=27349 RepID=A0A0L6VP19_9BASI|nr:DNA-directed RNA polymerase II subunit E [Puccinia sorghi]
MEDDREVARLHRVNRTIKELVRDRTHPWYLSLNRDTKSQTKKLISPSPTSRLVMSCLSHRKRVNFAAFNPETNQGIFVYYADEKSVGIKTMRKFISVLQERKIEAGILIYSQAMTPSANKVIASMAQQYALEAFQEAELLVNITHHIMVPKHEVMKPEEKKALLARYRLKDTQLPRIQLSDPVARYYGLKRGQVVRITRPSETAGRYVSYRLAM